MEYDQREVRGHDRRLAEAAISIRELKDVCAEESDVRLVEDNDILDTVIETQKLLQATVRVYYTCIFPVLPL